MKNYELLDMIGQVNESYVLAADEAEKVVRPRWQAWAAAAACAALVLCAYPAYRLGQSSGGAPAAMNDSPALHSYTLAEDAATGGAECVTADTGGEDKAMDGAAGYDAAEALTGLDTGDGYGENGQRSADKAAPAGEAAQPEEAAPLPEPSEAPAAAPFAASIAQGEAIAQYQRLLRGMGVPDIIAPEENPYPDWYAGAWLDNDYEAGVSRLMVAVVEGYHTPELEEQIAGWCRGQVVYAADMKYSYAQLKHIIDRVNAALMDSAQEEVWNVFSSMRLDEESNCVWVDFFGQPSQEALAFLAELDPQGDAIQVRAFTGRIYAEDGAVKVPMTDEAAAESGEGVWIDGEYCEPESGGGDAVISLPPGVQQSAPAGTGAGF